MINIFMILVFTLAKPQTRLTFKIYLLFLKVKFLFLAKNFNLLEAQIHCIYKFLLVFTFQFCRNYCSYKLVVVFSKIRYLLNRPF